jgi:uncharacterized protein (TIRG00374 family)
VAAVDPPVAAPPPSPWRARLRRYLAPAVAVVLVGVIFIVVLPRIADYREVLDAIQRLTWEQILLLLGVTALNVSTYAPPFMVALPGLRFVPALTVTQASTASTYVAPAGGPAVGMALAYGMLRAWGFEAGAVALAVTVTGVWNQFLQLGSPAVALALLTLTGGSNSLLTTVAVIALSVFVVAVAAFAAGLSSAELARRVGDLVARIAGRGLKLVHRQPVQWSGETLVVFRRQTIGLLRKRWWLLTLATIAGQGTVFLVLLVSLRTLGVSAGEVSFIEAFAAWSVARLIGSLPVVPASGLGVVELGLIGALVGFGGANADVVAAVLLYRVLTIVPTLLLGSAAAFTWRRQAKPAV